MGLAAAKPGFSAQRLLEHIGLEARARDKARDLSGGQMRRVEIVRALLHRPRLLLLDEPTVGLDIEARADILRHVRSLVSTEGLSTLWATHLIDEVAETDTVIVLHRGKVLAQGIAAEIVRIGWRSRYPGCVQPVDGSTAVARRLKDISPKKIRPG